MSLVRAWRQSWAVDVQPVGRGHTALRYLVAYVQKTALSAARLIDCDERNVTFTHQDRESGQIQSLRLTGAPFRLAERGGRSDPSDRPGPRDATIATATLTPGSLERIDTPRKALWCF